MPGISRPLKQFREIINALVDLDVAPTPRVMAHYGYTNPTTRQFNSGHYVIAREEELIKRGWRRISYKDKFKKPPLNAPNFRWLPCERQPAKSEGRKVVSQFRVGDQVWVYSNILHDMWGGSLKGIHPIVDYEAGELLDRDDLPKGASALVVQLEDDQVMVWDDELVLVKPTDDFPIKYHHVFEDYEQLPTLPFPEYQREWGEQWSKKAIRDRQTSGRRKAANKAAKK